MYSTRKMHPFKTSPGCMDVAIVPLSHTGVDPFSENRAAAARLRQVGGQLVPTGVTGATPTRRHADLSHPPTVFFIEKIAAPPCIDTVAPSALSSHEDGGPCVNIDPDESAIAGVSADTTSQNASSGPNAIPNRTSTVDPRGTSFDDGMPTGAGGPRAASVAKSAVATYDPPTPGHGVVEMMNVSFILKTSPSHPAVKLAFQTRPASVAFPNAVAHLDWSVRTESELTPGQKSGSATDTNPSIFVLRHADGYTICDAARGWVYDVVKSFFGDTVPFCRADRPNQRTPHVDGHFGRLTCAGDGPFPRLPENSITSERDEGAPFACAKLLGASSRRSNLHRVQRLGVSGDESPRSVLHAAVADGWRSGDGYAESVDPPA